MDAFNQSQAAARPAFGFVGSVALLIIDAQKEFADPARGRGNAVTDKVARHIAAMAPQFRDAGVSVYAVHDARNEQTPVFHAFAPAAGDTLVQKKTDSAFAGSDIDGTLQKDEKKVLLVCGFNASGCAYETAVDARKQGYDVFFVADMAADDDYAALNGRGQPAFRDTIKGLQENGIAFIASADALAAIRSAGKEMTAQKLGETFRANAADITALPDTLAAQPTSRAHAVWMQNYCGR